MRTPGGNLTTDCGLLLIETDHEESQARCVTSAAGLGETSRDYPGSFLRCFRLAPGVAEFEARGPRFEPSLVS